MDGIEEKRLGFGYYVGICVVFKKGESGWVVFDFECELKRSLVK